jgi:hypothetical protein
MCGGVISDTTINSQDVCLRGYLSFRIAFTPFCLGIYNFTLWFNFIRKIVFWRSFLLDMFYMCELGCYNAGLRAGQPKFNSRQERKIFLFSTASSRELGSVVG